MTGPERTGAAPRAAGPGAGGSTGPGAGGGARPGAVRHAAPGAGDHAVPDLDFAVTGVTQERYAAVPTLRFAVELSRTGGGPVRSVSLTTALRIDVTRRRYDARARAALAELFGGADQWADGLRPLPWTQTTVQVPAFDTRTTTGLLVPCGYDTELAVTKYLKAVTDGDVPLDFQFSGTVFYDGPGGLLRTARVSWSKDAACRLPAALWHELVERYYPGSPWLRLSAETWARLDAYRARQVCTGWDEAVCRLLDAAEAPADTPAT
ncbi:hypothetical protein JJV70_07310 [Streptomyces sp. JJ66]|uniref:DUF6084 family protein n=1 Tax=Streptomyces sp. JJ66 TaxID=2803843 RepID=UPI001C591E95|nr:DUF6084 family protein [Streptomyces sp. JJ66]MBW1601921.1 hypothetical protein [Streptomyces sp. JJ66]